MTDYSKLSDREIDRLVLNIIYGVHANDKDIQGCWSRGGFKYTSDVSDAWPIIVDNLISIDWHFNGSYKRVWGYSEKGLVELKCLQFDILRAAMIVFLEMQENKQ